MFVVGAKEICDTGWFKEVFQQDQRLTGNGPARSEIL
jgi:hypothetical protein